MTSHKMGKYLVIAIIAAGIGGSGAYLYRHMDDRTVTGAATSEPPPSMVPAGTASGMGKSSMVSGGGAPKMGEASTAALPTIDVAAEKMAKRLQANGGTGDEWALLARTYVELKRYPDAVNAYARAIEKMPGNEALQTEQAAARAAAGAPAR